MQTHTNTHTYNQNVTFTTTYTLTHSLTHIYKHTHSSRKYIKIYCSKQIFERNSVVEVVIVELYYWVHEVPTAECIKDYCHKRTAKVSFVVEKKPSPPPT